MRALFLAFGLATLSLPAAAADKSNGCGAGWYVTQRMSLSATTTRGTTNGILPPTFSMTSGTSNCAQHGIATKEKASEMLVEATYDRLRDEVARGEGEFVDALLGSIGCSNGGELLQLNYDGIFTPGASAGEVVRHARAVLRMGGCGAA